MNENVKRHLGFLRDAAKVTDGMPYPWMVGYLLAKVHTNVAVRDPALAISDLQDMAAAWAVLRRELDTERVTAISKQRENTDLILANMTKVERPYDEEAASHGEES